MQDPTLNPPLVADAGRLSALLACNILDTEPEGRFDDIAVLAAALCGTPVALVSFITEDRQWFKAKVGVDLSGTPLEQSVCAHGLAQTGLLVIPDLTLDPRTAANPLVTQAPHIRFYAGAPLATTEGFVLGMVCVIDLAPRPGGLTDAQAAGLKALARQVMSLVALRREIDAGESQAELAQSLLAAQEAGKIGTFEVDIDQRAITVSPEFCRIFGLPVRTVFPVEEPQGQVVEDDSHIVSSHQSRGKGSSPLDVEYRIRRRDDGRLRWIGRRASFVRDGTGRPVKMRGAVQDITERRLSDQRVNGLLALGDELRSAASVADVVQASSEVLVEALFATRAGYAEVDYRGGAFVVEHDYTRGDAVSIAGRHPFSAFKGAADRLARGEIMAVADTADDEPGEDLAAYVSIGVRAMLDVPLLVRGELVGVLFVHDAVPRTWSRAEIEFVESVADRTYSTIAKLRAEAEQQTLNHELSHRLKNTLTMVQAIAAQTLAGVSERAVVDGFNQRLHALGSAHDLLLGSSWKGAPLDDVARQVIGALGHAGGFQLSGPTVDLNPQTTLSLSLLLHELTTNAIKYGALSAEGGRVTLAWEVTDDPTPQLALRWIESGGPPVRQPGRRGFGSRLIKAGLAPGTRVDLRYEGAGLEAYFVSPLNNLIDLTFLGPPARA